MEVKSRLSECRYIHTCSMRDMALSLAECYGVDKDVVWTAAMLHDIAKELSPDLIRHFKWSGGTAFPSSL